MNTPDRLETTVENRLSKLGPLEELRTEIRKYPVRLLKLLVALYEERAAPVPDHMLKLPPYLGETVLRALVEGGMVEIREASYAIRAYAPTQEAIRIVAELSTAVAAGRKAGAKGTGAPSARRRNQAAN